MRRGNGEAEATMERAVLITGASSGIGAAAARRLQSRGFTVFGTSRKPEKLGADAPPIRWVAVDVRSEESVRAGVAEVLSATPRLHGVVCNAGFGIFGSVEETPISEVREQFETNFFGTLHTLRAVLPHMREARAGRIAVVGSLAGRAPIPFQAHYSATKGAVDALTQSLYNELRPFGVKVSLVEPGDINTPFNAGMTWGDPSRSAYGEGIRNTERVVRESLPRAPGPEVVAKVIEHALTARRPRARYAVGADSWLVPLCRRLLPDRIALRLIGRHFEI
jgi:NAD(P)-dependent dehydrogenase (short-subunit alcohol dehydrogenase family)